MAKPPREFVSLSTYQFFQLLNSLLVWHKDQTFSMATYSGSEGHHKMDYDVVTVLMHRKSPVVRLSNYQCKTAAGHLIHTLRKVQQ